MDTEKKFQALADIIGDATLSSAQIADRGGCLLTNGCRENLRYYLDKMVGSGILEKVKTKGPRRPVGGRQFAGHSCKWAYRKAGGAA